MKKIVIVLSTIFCMFVLGACGEEAVQPLTDETAVSMGQEGQTLMEQIVALSDQELATQIEYFSENGDAPNTVLYNGLSSWNSSRGELGAYVSTQTPVVTRNENGAYVITMSAQFENRQAVVTMTTDKNVTTWESITFEANYSLGEKLQKAAMNTLMGMVTVFVVLIIIIGCISCFSFIPKIEAKFRKKSEEIDIPIPEPVVPVEPEEENLTDDLELVAVITAAIAAAEETSTDGLVVRAIRRVGTSKWKRA